MKHLDLFSGIGGFALAARWTEKIETVGFCEIDEYCQKDLKKNWPNVPIADDIKELKNNGQFGTIDIITGGFPCQPFSVAGKQRGKNDDRDLWPEMLRVIKEFKPTWVIGENVAGFVNMELERTAVNLESEGYEVRPLIIPACAVDAKHERKRVWILGYSGHLRRTSFQKTGIFNKNELRCKERENSAQQSKGSSCSEGGLEALANSESNLKNGVCRKTMPKSYKRNAWVESERGSKRQSFKQPSQILANTTSEGLQGCPWALKEGFGKRPSFSSQWQPEPSVGRVADGVPSRVDRLKGLGNAIVPQVAYVIMSHIL